MYSRVHPDILDDRLDAERYSRDQVANLARLRAFGAVSMLSLIDPARSNYGVLPSSEEYVESGLGLVRGGDLDHGNVRDPAVFAPLSYATRRGTLKADDVLILAKGACIDGPAGVGLVTSHSAGRIFNGTSYRLHMINADPAYVVAFAMTNPFLLQKRREISNTGISYNSEDAIHGFLVPRCDRAAQAYIGSKVRQAEVLRERAREVRREAEAAVRRLISVPLLSGEGRTQRVPSRALGSRLDTNYYNPLAVFVEASMRAAGRVMPLNEIIQADRTITNGVRGPDLVPSPYKLVRLQDCADWTVNYDGCHTISADQFRENARCRLRAGDVVVAIGGYVGNAAVVLDDTPAVVGQHSAVIPVDPSGPLLPHFLTVYLNSEIAAAQFGRYVSGTVQAGINLEDLRGIEVPVPPKGVQERVSELAMRFLAASAAVRSLVTASRFLVEALVEGTVTEHELIAAAHDPMVDRTLLARITTSGLDAPGRVLFPDLDAHVHLLATLGSES